MNIADYIAQNGAESVAAFLKSQPAFSVFNLAWHAPADILPACNALGLVTVDDAKAYALSLYSDKAATFAELARPRPVLAPDPPFVTIWPEIHNLFGDAGLLHPNALVTHSDRNYLKPSYDEVVALAKAFPGRNRKWLEETHDCDDFTDELLGWLASIGYGNYAFGFAGILLYSGDQLLAGHAVATVLTRDKGLQWIEPQGGSVLPLDYKAFAGQWFCNKVLVHTLIF